MQTDTLNKLMQTTFIVIPVGGLFVDRPQQCEAIRGRVLCRRSIRGQTTLSHPSRSSRRTAPCPTRPPQRQVELFDDVSYLKLQSHLDNSLYKITIIITIIAFFDTTSENPYPLWIRDVSLSNLPQLYVKRHFVLEQHLQ